LYLLVACLPAAAADVPAVPGAVDALYRALHGEPQAVDAAKLLEGPGLYVGRAVRTRGRLERSGTGQHAFALSAGRGRLLLRLEPQAAAMTAGHAAAWTGNTVEVEGFFYRDIEDSPEASYALRAWLVQPPAALRPAATGTASVPLVTLQDLVYGAGRHDGHLVRVRGTYRGPNVQRDLPEASRKAPHDWVLKDGYFAAWVTGREAFGSGRAGEAEALQDTGAALEVVGTPTTASGVVRITAREVRTSAAPAAPVMGRALSGSGAGWAAVAPRLSFAYPVPDEPLRASGQVILQFNKPMDPSRFDGAVTVRYEREGAAAGSPRVALDYRDRYRAVVITPDPAPPRGAVMVVELGDGIIDVDGRALAPLEEPLRFRRER
jgi:hypothetical protein